MDSCYSGEHIARDHIHHDTQENNNMLYCGTTTEAPPKMDFGWKSVKMDVTSHHPSIKSTRCPNVYSKNDYRTSICNSCNYYRNINKKYKQVEERLEMYQRDARLNFLRKHESWP